MGGQPMGRIDHLSSRHHVQARARYLGALVSWRFNSSDQIERRNLVAEHHGAVDELGQELVQSQLEDVLDAAVAQPSENLTGEPVALAPLSGIGLGQEIEGARDLVV